MLTTLPIAHIKPNDYNPNTIDAVKFDTLKNLIEKFGFLQPILVEPANEEGAHIIIDGKHRWRAPTNLVRF